MGGHLYNNLGNMLCSFSSREGWIPYYMVTLSHHGMDSGSRMVASWECDKK